MNTAQDGTALPDAFRAAWENMDEAQRERVSRADQFWLIRRGGLWVITTRRPRRTRPRRVKRV